MLGIQARSRALLSDGPAADTPRTGRRAQPSDLLLDGLAVLVTEGAPRRHPCQGGRCGSLPTVSRLICSQEVMASNPLGFRALSSA